MTPASKAKQRAVRRPARSAAPRRKGVAKRPKPKLSAKKVAKPPARPAKKAAPRPAPKAAEPSAPVAPPPLRTGDARRHVLSLSFLRDGDEFLARLETDGGQITELKNRALDQLLTLVAGELEDLLE